MTDVIVIGGGVIGLSIARELSGSGKETIVLEKNERAGDCNIFAKFWSDTCWDLLSRKFFKNKALC